MVKEILEALPTDALKKKFEHLVATMECAENDNEVWEAKWRGDWPNFEWIKEEKEKRGFK